MQIKHIGVNLRRLRAEKGCSQRRCLLIAVMDDNNKEVGIRGKINTRHALYIFARSTGASCGRTAEHMASRHTTWSRRQNVQMVNKQTRSFREQVNGKRYDKRARGLLYGGGTSYREIGAAGGQDDFVRVHALPFGSQGAIHERAALQQAVEHRNQRVLVVVPPQTELLLLLLLVIHDGGWISPSCRRSCEVFSRYRAANSTTTTTTGA